VAAKLQSAPGADKSLYAAVYNCLHGTATSYLQDVTQLVAAVTSRRQLRSASSSALMVPATRRSSLGTSLCGCCMEQFTSVRHRLLVSYHLQEIGLSQDLFIQVTFLEHESDY